MFSYLRALPKFSHLDPDGQMDGGFGTKLRCVVMRHQFIDREKNYGGKNRKVVLRRRYALIVGRLVKLPYLIRGAKKLIDRTVIR